MAFGIFALAFFATALLYWPGLGGTYFFDDYPNIVDNLRLHVDSLDWRRWLQAAWSSPSSDLQRPLSSLTFALNYFFDGLNPWPMKACNLAIHLLNGGLLYLLLLRIGRLMFPERVTQAREQLLPLLVSAAWLLHPINVTTVLYVVQRMEGLAQLFVLAGLCVYVEARRRLRAREDGAIWRLWMALPCLTAIGMLAKETAALLPLLALVIEFTLPRARESQSTWRCVAGFFIVFLLLPLTLGLAWLLPHVLSPEAYSGRAFTLTQRLLTEPRVLLDYAAWTLFPLPGFFSFYHDNIAISTSLWQPWTTLPGILVLAVALASGILLRRQRPLVAMGLLWFLAAHSLTATVIPLEIAFEHRNYFASIGLILATFDLLLPRAAVSISDKARYVSIVAMLALCGFSTFLRAREWSNPLTLAGTEAAHNLDSARAAYEYGRTLVVLSDYRADSPLVPRAFEVLDRAARIPGAGILADVALVMLASRTGHPIEAAWWRSIRDKLQQRPPAASDDEALKSLTLCQRDGRCVLDDDEMLQIYLAAVNRPAASSSILYSYAIFAGGRLHDADLALRLAHDAADKSNDLQYRLNLVDLLISLKQYDDAAEQLDMTRNRDRRGAFSLDVEKRAQELRGIRPPLSSESASIPK